MKRTFFIMLLSLAGCASVFAAGKSQKLPVENADAGNVSRMIEQVLDRGDAVRVEVECITSYDGLTAGYRPEDYGCEDDNDAIVATEKFILREVLGQYSRFSVYDGNNAAVPPAVSPVAADAVAADPAADGNAVQVSSATPPVADEEAAGAALSSETNAGITHRIVIEVCNHFSRESGFTVCHYIEKRQLQDVQNDTVLAADRFTDSKAVEYRPSSRNEVTIGVPDAKPFSFEDGNSPFVSRMKEREVMTDNGSHKYYTIESGVPGSATAASRTPETTASTKAGIVRSSSRPGAAHPIPARQLARVLKQRSQALHDKSDQEALERFLELCPEDKDRIVVADPEQ